LVELRIELKNKTQKKYKNIKTQKKYKNIKTQKNIKYKNTKKYKI
jgi:hypothetical protein